MKILVVGAGGLGTLFGAFLTQAGAEVAMLVKPEHLDRLRAQGNCLKVEGAQAAEVPATPVTSGEQVGAVDWLILSVKDKGHRGCTGRRGRVYAGRRHLATERGREGRMAP